MRNEWYFTNNEGRVWHEKERVCAGLRRAKKTAAWFHVAEVEAGRIN